MCACVCVPWGYGDLRARQTVNFTNYRTLGEKEEEGEEEEKEEEEEGEEEEEEEEEEGDEGEGVRTETS